MTSRPVDILVSVDRESPRTLGRQIEDQLRQAIRDATLRPGSRLPSTRDLARELGVSRPIVVDAYAQLAGEGYLELRPGTRPRVTGCAGPCQPPTTRRADPLPEPRYDLRPGVPDLSTFPRSAWLRSLREALASMRDADFGYTDPHGTRGAPAGAQGLPGPGARRGDRCGPGDRHQRLLPGADAGVPRAGGDGERGASRSRTPATTKSGAPARAPAWSWCRCRWTARGSGWTRWSGRRCTRCS